MNLMTYDIEFVKRSSRRLRGTRHLGCSKLDSHISRGDPAFAGLAISQEVAEQIIETVLSNSVRIIKGYKTMDIYHANGQGVRLELDTLKFQTFLEASESSR